MSRTIISWTHKRTSLLKEILAPMPLLSGSFGIITVTCGKKNCRCTSGKKHPLSRMTWIEKSQSHTRSVPKEKMHQVKKAIQNHRNFRKTLKQIQKTENVTKRLLVKYEKNAITQTRQSLFPK
mgnify:CR=1 FL=1